MNSTKKAVPGVTSTEGGRTEQSALTGATFSVSNFTTKAGPISSISRERRSGTPIKGAAKKHPRSDYKICEYCGAALDVGERCDCQDCYETGYKRGYADGYQKRPYEAYADRLSDSSEYEHGYSVGYEDGVFREPPEYEAALDEGKVLP